MRISDWSSDVCSSDLHFGASGVVVREKLPLRLAQCIQPVAEAALRIALRLQQHVHPRRQVGDLFARSEEHTSELQSLMRNSYAVFCLKKKKPLSLRLILNQLT